MEPLDHTTLKHGFTTHAVPLAAMAGLVPLRDKPRIGLLVVAEVLRLGKHTTLEGRAGVAGHIFPGDRIVGAFGNRYATDQYEGYVPDRPVDECDLLSIGGVCGEVVSRHDELGPPTRLRVLGAVGDRDGRPLNQRAFGLRPPSDPAPGATAASGDVILVVGASMNSGKTTVVGTLARALSRAGLRVAAAKLTGTAAGKDARYYTSCGARPVLEFTDVGYPSTYLLDSDELTRIHRTLLGHLRASGPDYILFEIADGIFQRETRLLLEDPALRAGVHDVFFAANDSLSAACGVRWLQEHGLPLRATSGMVTRSPLATREAEEATGVPCLSTERLLAGQVTERLVRRALRPDGAVPPRALLPAQRGADATTPARPPRHGTAVGLLSR